jgi:hypothetical protein
MDDASAIASYYQLDPTHPAPLSVGGLRAFAAIDRRDSARRVIAVQARSDLPPRAKVLTRLGPGLVPLAMTPLDHGPGRDPGGQEGWFMVCAAPPGPALAASVSAPGGAWTEAEAVRCLLLPAAAALEALAGRGITHRGIRPDNVFRAGPSQPVTLGPFWATPPASLQPAAFEPSYVAMCPPPARGEGTIADDIYALGALMLWCLLGGPAAWADSPAMLRRKLAQESMPVLSAGASISGGLFELLRLMLAEDPDHRPTPALLLATDQARTRRLATRPQRRAARPIDIGDVQAWSARELAFGVARHPDAALAQIRDGAVDRWLRRMLGDGQLAVHVEEAVAIGDIGDKADSRQQSLLLMRAVWAMDPLAPLIWRGIALFPDGIGGALAAAQANGQAAIVAAIEELVASDIIAQWSVLQTKRRDFAGLRQDLIDWRGWLTTRGPMGGARRLTYGLNALLPCASPLLAGACVARLADLLPALDAAAARADRKRPPFDAHIAAFVAARADAALLADIGHVDGFATAAERRSVLRLFASLQTRLHPVPLPGLAAWLMESGLIDLTLWRNLNIRKSIGGRLAEQAGAGNIASMVRLVHDDAAQQADHVGAEHAAARAAAIEAELAAIQAAAAQRRVDAERVGHAMAAGAAMLAMLGSALALGLAV